MSGINVFNHPWRVLDCWLWLWVWCFVEEEGGGVIASHCLCMLCLFNFLAEHLLARQVTALRAYKPAANFRYSENMLATKQALRVKELSIAVPLWHSWARVRSSYTTGWWRGHSGDHGGREGGTIPVILVEDLWQPWGWTTQISFKRGGESTDTLSYLQPSSSKAPSRWLATTSLWESPVPTQLKVLLTVNACSESPTQPDGNLHRTAMNSDVLLSNLSSYFSHFREARLKPSLQISALFPSSPSIVHEHFLSLIQVMCISWAEWG